VAAEDEDPLMRRDRNGMEVLSRTECLARLGTSGIGRVAMTVGAEPAIFPVNYATHDRGVVFRTMPGLKLAHAARGAVLAFEVDGFNAMGHTGWSVVLVGPARVVDDAAELAALERLPVSRWTLGRGHEATVHIRAERLTGRKITYEVA
jgi:uncharacterized protein